MMTRRHLLKMSAAGVAVSTAGLVPQGIAQPSMKTAHILTGFTPGLPDAVARLIAGQLKNYADSIVIETRPGAGGRVAAEAVKAAAADGSVMLFAPLGFVMLFPHVYKTLRYEPQEYPPVSTAVSFPTLLTVGPKVPSEARTLADFIAWCLANPKHATYGTAGVGTTLHFIGAMLGRTAGFAFLHVPYQGCGRNSRPLQRRDRIGHHANRQFFEPRPIRRSPCARVHRSAPQLISSRCADNGGNRLFLA